MNNQQTNIEKNIKNNIENNIENIEYFNKLMNELDILSNIKEYDKLSIKNTINIDTPYLFQSFFRTFSGDSRNKTIEYIQNLINDICNYTTCLLNEESNYMTHSISLYYTNENMFDNNNNEDKLNEHTIEVLNNISTKMKLTINGIQNLKITYLHDIIMTSKLDMIIVQIQNRCNKINKLI